MMAKSMCCGTQRCQPTSGLGDLELMFNLPQPKSALAQQIPAYTANAAILLQPVLSFRPFGLFMVFLTNKAFKFLISQISKSFFLCVCLLALLSSSPLGICFWLPSWVILFCLGLEIFICPFTSSQGRLFMTFSSRRAMCASVRLKDTLFDIVCSDACAGKV